MNATLPRPASHLRRISLLIAVGVAQLLPNVAQATTTKWSNASGGNWSNPSNWDNGLPSSTNDAVFDLAGTYTVTLDADFGIRSCDANSSGLTLVIPGGRTLSISGPSAQLRVRGGSHVNSNGLIDVSGGLASIDFSNSSTNFSGSLRVLNGNLTAVGFPSTTGPATLTLNGTCTLSGLTPNGWMVVVQGSSGGGNAHTNLSGGLVNGVMRLESIDGAYAAEVQGGLTVQAGGICNVEPGTGGTRKIIGGATVRAQGVLSANADLEVEPSFQELNINDQGQVTVAAGKRLSLIGFNPTLRVVGVLTMGSGALTEIGSGGLLAMENPGNIVGELRLLNGSVQSSGYLNGPPGPAQLLLRGTCSLNSATQVWSGWTVVVQGSSAGGNAHASMPSAVTRGVLRFESIDGPYAAELQGVISVDAGGRCDIEPGAGGTRKISGAVHVNTQGVMNVNADLEVNGLDLALTIADQGQLTVAAGKRLSLTGTNLTPRVDGVLTMGSGSVTEIGSGGILDMVSPGNIIGELRLLNGSLQTSGYLSGPPGPAQLVLRGTCSLNSATQVWSGWTVVVQGSSAGGNAHANIPSAVTRGVLRLESIDGPYAAEVQGVISVEAGGRCDIEPGTGGTRKISGAVHVRSQGVMNVNADLEVDEHTQGLEINDQGQLTVAAGKRLSLTGTNPALTVSGTLTMDSGASTEIANGASVQVNFDGYTGGTASGTINYLGSWSLLFFHSSGSVSIGGPGTDYWPSNAVPTNVWVNGPGGLTMTAPRSVAGNISVAGPVINANQLTIGQGAEIRAGGAFLGIPAYGSSLTLTYNTGGTRGRGDEWSATAGPGYPANVVITGNTVLDLGNGGPGVARQCGGDLTINPGSLLSMNNSPNEMTAPLTVLGNVTGAVTLSTLAGADLNVTGSLNTVTIIGNGRTIFLQGNGTQGIDGSLSSIGRLVLAKGGGSVQLFSNVVAGSQQGSDGLQFNGTTDVLDLNGRQLGVVGSIGGTNPSGGFRGSPSSVLTLDGSAVVGSVNFLAGAQALAALVVNRPGGSVSLATPLTLTSSLALTAGKVITGANTLTIAAGGTVTGASASSYVQGNLKKTVTISGGSGNKSFEIGDANVYSPVDLSTTTGTANFDVTASTTAGDHPSIATSGIEASRSVNRRWSLLSSAPGNFASANLTFHFDPSEVDAGANTANFKVRKFDAPSTWTTTGVGTRTSTSTQATGVAGFSDFQIGSVLDLSIGDVTATEGDAGLEDFDFDVLLSESSADTVKAIYQTADGSATVADNDYLVGTGIVAFPPGTTSKTVTVKVKGDYTTEPDEWFAVQLISSIKAEILDDEGIGTIEDDDEANILCDGPYAANGAVYSVVESNGVIYVGGSFGVAAINAETGLPTGWNPGADGPVYSLVVNAGTVYAAGAFSHIGGQPRNYLAALDATTGLATGWDPNPNEAVLCLAAGGGTLYAGGEFTVVNGEPFNHAAAWELATGFPTAWYPQPDDLVRAIAVSGSTVYLGGDFHIVGSQARQYYAAVDASLGVPTEFTSSPNNSVTSLAVSGGTVYLGGYFTVIDLQGRDYLCAVDATTAVPTAWNPTANAPVRALAIDGGTLYAGGDFTSMGGQPRGRLAAIEAASGTVAAWNPNANSSVYALSAGAGTVYAGGLFSAIAGAPRNYFACIHASTKISISDATVIEGDYGSKTAAFTVLVTPTPASPMSVDFISHDGTALIDDDNDYEEAGGTLLFQPGQSSQPIEVTINGDVKPEDDETFQVELFNASGATIVDAFAIGTILDDDAGQSVCKDLWVTNGTVNAIVESGGTIYVGGDFTQVGPATGGGVPIDGANGATLSQPMVVGRVFAAVPDGAGGFYLGGDFTRVAGVRCARLAHLLADHTLSPWIPNPSGPVYALALSGGVLYVGGDFTTIGGQSRSRIAAIDVATGNATAWNPNANSGVFSLAAGNGVVYAGGLFQSIGGQTRNRIAALDPALGNATAWNPNANSIVQALLVSGNTVYASGNFSSIGGQSRNMIAALSATTGNATAWNPNPLGNWVGALAKSGTTIYVGGSFDQIGGQMRPNIAAVDSATGNATGWAPSTYGIGYVSVDALAVSGNTVYAGGNFFEIGYDSRNYLGALDNDSGEALPGWNPNADAPVKALAVSGNIVFAGGEFSSLGGVARNHLAAFGPTGAATAWNPNPNGRVNALAAAGGIIYAGGEFTTIGGQPRNRIAAVHGTTGAVQSWNPNANSSVTVLTESDGVLYVAGNFTQIGGQDRNHLAALDEGTVGSATSWNPNPIGTVNAMVVTGGAVYVGGNFSEIGYGTHLNLAKLDLDPGEELPFSQDTNAPVNALLVSGTVIYVGGNFTTIGGDPRNRLAALDAGSGATTAWNPNANSTVNALAASGGRVYAGGLFTSIGGQARRYLAELDPGTGLASPLAPDADNSVAVLRASGPRVYAGGYFASIGGLSRRSLACFVTQSLVDVPTGEAPVTEIAFVLFPNPTHGAARLHYALPHAAHVRISVFDVQGRVIARPVDGVQSAGRHDATWDGASRGAKPGLYFVRFEAEGRRETRRLILIR